MAKVVEHKEDEVFDIELEEKILKKNEDVAKENSQLFKTHNIKTIDIMGSIGSGKTSLIEALVKRLKEKYSIAVLNGDLTTTIDSDRVAKHGVDVVQINTGKECHLDANLVSKALGDMDLDQLDLILIENVGNLICPGEFRLGAEQRLVVISVTEGPYMVLKHPFIFMEANVVVINKLDLAEAMNVEFEKLKADVIGINPKAEVIGTSCKNERGIIYVIGALQLV
ncbi:MAG: hydrogenase nickel incorporation protein HypB [Candidatus Bathyarchaeota archaeon]|nr:hydrogenase nickel incorporation protein HypB [Candidatus Bathyarchaeota archaeon]